MNNSDRPAGPISVVASSRFPDYKYETGLTKRETFAMAAMQGLLASKYYGEFCNKTGIIDEARAISLVATKRADELLKELGKL